MTLFLMLPEPSHDLSSQNAFHTAGLSALCFLYRHIEAVCPLIVGGGKSFLNIQCLSAYTEATNKLNLGLTFLLDLALSLYFSRSCDVEYLVFLCPTPHFFLGVQMSIIQIFLLLCKSSC